MIVPSSSVEAPEDFIQGGPECVDGTFGFRCVLQPRMVPEARYAWTN
jgi:hypothetical protein